MLDGKSDRSGLVLKVPFMALTSISIQSGKFRLSAASTDALIRKWPFAFSTTSTTSPGFT